MTDINALVERLRRWAKEKRGQEIKLRGYDGATAGICDEAAEALTAQRRENEKLRQLLREAKGDVDYTAEAERGSKQGAAASITSDRIAAALAGTAGDGWREMDSAPKDGTPFLAEMKYRDGGESAGAHAIKWHEPWGEWVLSAVLIQFDNTGDLSDDATPTLWRPLPAPPAQEDGS